MSQIPENQEEDATPTGWGEDFLSTAGDCRRKASSLYRKWAEGRRKITPHELGAVISALNNVAGMIEKERADRVAELEAKVAELEAALARAKAEPRSPCPDQTPTFASLN